MVECRASVEAITDSWRVATSWGLQDLPYQVGQMQEGDNAGSMPAQLWRRWAVIETTKNDSLSQCWINVGLASLTADSHKSSIGSMDRVCGNGRERQRQLHACTAVETLACNCNGIEPTWAVIARWYWKPAGTALFNPLISRLFNFNPLEFVSRWCDPQLQVSENYSDLTKWISMIFIFAFLLIYVMIWSGD